MYTELSMDDAGLSRAVSALDRMYLAGETLTETVFPVIVNDFHRMEKRRFDAEGPGWEQLSPTTRLIRQRKGIPPDNPILHGTGRLRAAMTGESDELRLAYLGDELLISVPFYAEFHQIGPRQIRVFGRHDATLPQRKVWEIREVDAMRWAKIVKAGLRITGADLVLDLDALATGEGTGL